MLAGSENGSMGSVWFNPISGSAMYRTLKEERFVRMVKKPSGKAAASEEPRRYRPHFVWVVRS